MNLDIDRLCVEFEDALRSGSEPRIEEFLARSSSEIGEELFEELLALEVEKRGATNHAGYAVRFPGYSAIVDRVFHARVDLQRPTFTTGDRLGRYKVHELLGKGSFGRIYRGKDTELGREVALKVPRLTDTATGATAEAFCREAKSLASLHHQNVLSIYDIVRDDQGWPVLVLEHLRGKPLSELMPADHSQSVDWLAQICDGLAFAHQRGVVHRDLKPQNIFIADDNRAVLLDFGLSLQYDSRKHHEGESAGTLRYMSPEQVRGESHWMDGRSDVWSIGVLLYEVLTGRLPFVGETPKEMSRAILEQPVRPPRQIQPNIDPRLEAICLKCLEKNAPARYATASDLARELRRRSAGPTISRRVLVAAAVLVAALLALVSYRIRQVSDDAKPVSRSSEPLTPVNAIEETVSDEQASLAVFDFEETIDPWYSSADYKRVVDAKTGNPYLAITDLSSHEDGAFIDITQLAADSGLLWFEAKAKSLGETFPIQLQIEQQVQPFHPNLRYEDVSTEWRKIAGGFCFSGKAVNRKLIVRPNTKVFQPFAIDDIRIMKLREVPESEIIPNGNFDGEELLWQPDAGEVVINRVADNQTGWCLSLSERSESDSGIVFRFDAKANSFYLFRAKVRAKTTPFQTRLLLKRPTGNSATDFDYTGLKRREVAETDSWTTLEEVYRVPSDIDGRLTVSFGIMSVDSTADFFVDDISVVELCPAAVR
ncbi:MAG: protein kinase [Planctomycetaceae bacterium]